ncbi:uncharacterized protein LOC143863994 [Tasmannia lanceolata]|uniref:uncharacterized protein LOC143863994 n=1 Tax=Tasmannia lanceolata TaxID=3420 RepID=UPI00406334DE
MADDGSDSSYPDPTKSPYSDSVLGLWEDSVVDNSLFLQGGPSSSTEPPPLPLPPLNPPPLASNPPNESSDSEEWIDQLWDFVVKVMIDEEESARTGANYPPQQQRTPTDGVNYPPQEQGTMGGFNYPPQEQGIMGGVNYPPQEQGIMGGVNYPPQEQGTLMGGVNYPSQEQGQMGGVNYSPQEQLTMGDVNYTTHEKAIMGWINYPTEEEPTIGLHDGSVIAAGQVNPITSDVDNEINDSSLMVTAPDQFECAYCEVLRVVIHANDTHRVKLEIHGALGILYHGKIETKYPGNNGVPENVEHHHIDFMPYSMEEVKQFLVEYGETRKREGLTLVHDKISDFYKTLCTPMNIAYSNTNLLQIESQQQQQQPQQQQSVQREHGESRVLRPTRRGIEKENKSLRRTHKKSSIAVQRERTMKLKLNDFVPYFHLPITLAAKRLNLCPTVLKKICRRFFLKRWPYRKLKSIDRKIANLKEDLAANKGGEAADSIKANIERLRQDRVRVCCGFGAPNAATYH